MKDCDEPVFEDGRTLAEVQAEGSQQRYFIDHGMVHDRVTGRHVDLDALEAWTAEREANAVAEVDRVGVAAAHEELTERRVLAAVAWVLRTGLPYTGLPFPSEASTGVCSTCGDLIARDGTCRHVRELLDHSRPTPSATKGGEP